MIYWDSATCEIQGFCEPHQSDVTCVCVTVVAFMDHNVAHKVCRSEESV